MKLFYLFLFCLILVACNNQVTTDDSNISSPEPQEENIYQYIKDGDLVLRSDDDLVGLTLRNMNDSDKTYSHSGLLFKENNAWYVYHMMAGEENPSLKMRRDSLHHFIDPANKAGFAIYRYRLTDNETTDLHQLLQQQFAQPLLFDTAFDLKDHSKMYCTEMIAHNLAQVSQQRIRVPTTYKRQFTFKANTRGRSGKRNLTYIAVDNLYLNEHCRFITSKRYHP
jgi:hypothetical protein